MPEQGEKVSRKERERQAHQQEILEAAERVIVAKGFDAATVEEIAKEADFSVGAIYNFFDNKEKLCAAVMSNIADDFGCAFRNDVLTRHDPFDAINALVELRLRHVQRHGGFFRLLMDMKSGSKFAPDSAIPESCRDLYDRYLDEAAGLFRKAMDAGTIRKMDPLYAALCLEGVLNAFTAFWTRRGYSEPVERRIEDIKRNVLRHILENGNKKRAK